jgi:uncharacterized membrane protein YphA (DoxX/SURF4 family)
MNPSKLQWLPVLGLAFVFLYFGITKFTDPVTWMGWIPSYMNGFLGLSKAGWNVFAGISEILFGILILVPRTRWIGATGMALELLFITVTLTKLSETGIRDIGLLFMAVYLVFSSIRR